MALVIGALALTGILILWIRVDEKLPYRMFKKFSSKF
jgi:O-antigen/teichoic acid export membrane protein